MLKIISEGDMLFRLLDPSDAPIGWIAGRAIGFRGFSSEAVAQEAAAAGWQALDATMSQQYPGWVPHIAQASDLQLAHNGPYEWFHAGHLPIARLIRPGRRAYDTSFGIELLLPSYASEGVAINAAQGVASALLPLRAPSG